ncbi:AAA family ATPase [Empedobacter falsenii]
MTSGAAGTGKTIAALHRLKFLVNLNTIDKPILFTTFTKELSENLKNLASELIDKTNSYAINNIDSLAFELAKNYKLLSDTDKIFGFGNYKTPLEIWEAVLDDQLTSYDENFLCDEFENVILNQQISNKEEYLKASRVGRGKPVSRKHRFEIWDLIEKFLERKSTYRLFYKEEVYNLVSKYLLENEIHVFSHVIVDELQDFSNVELKFIRSLVESKENDLFLVGDPLQNIYNKKINFSKLGINIRGNRSKRLKINYRTTEEIKKFAFKVIKDEVYDDFDNGEEEKSGYLSLFHGIKPTYVTFNDKEEELFRVYNQIIDLLSEGFHYNDIVVAARTKDGVNDFRNYFHKMKLPYQDKHLLNNKLEGVRLSTFHGIKGLEFKHVFLVNVNDRTFPLKFSNFNSLSEQEQLQHLRGEKSLMYVASSRAILSLNVTGTGQRNEYL